MIEKTLMADSSVRFDETRGVVIGLLVNAPAGVVTAEALCAFLFSLRVQVLSIAERASLGRVERRLAVCDFAGGPIRARRRRDVERALRAVLSAQFEPVRPPVRPLPAPPMPPPEQMQPVKAPATTPPRAPEKRAA